MASRDVTELRDREEQLEVAAHAFERMAEAHGDHQRGRPHPHREPGLLAHHGLRAGRGARPPRERVPLRRCSRSRSTTTSTPQVLRSGRWDGTTWCRRRDGTVYREWRSVSAVRDAGERVTHYVSLFRELDRRGAGDEGLPERPAKSA